MTQSRTYPILGQGALTPEVRTVLRQIGDALDQHRRLRVHDHGLVALDPAAPEPTAPKEKYDGRQRKGRPPARSREGAARRKGSSKGSRQAAAASRDGGNLLRNAYEGQVTRLAEAYPTLQTFPDDNGMWLLARGSIISGLAREATFLVALPDKSGPGPRAWAFWTANGQFVWIGPRHTNFGDGSICAFSPDDGTWAEGEDLRTLLDLYSAWALRHLHLEYFGRWPGKQYSLVGADPRVQAWYRKHECQADELCGCGSESRRYADCCQPFDLQLNILKVAPLFLRATNGGFGTRQPPPAVLEFIDCKSAIPRIADVHLQIESHQPTE